MAAITLSDIIAQANAVAKGSAALAQQSAEASQNRADSARKIADNTRESSAILQGLEEKRALAEMEAKKLAKNNAAALGTDSTASSEIITTINSQIRNDLLRFNQASQELERLDANSNLFGNTLGWLESILTRGDYEAAATQAQARLDANTTMLSRMYALTDSDTKTQLALAETADASDIALASRAAALNADSNARKAEIEAAGFDIEGYRTLYQLGNEEFSRNATIYNAVKDAQRHSEAMEVQRLQVQIAQARLAQAQRPDVTEQYLDASINTATRGLGMPEIPKEVISANYGKGTPLGQRLAMLEIVGTNSINNGTLTIGPSPIISREAVNNLGGGFPKSFDPDVIRAFDVADTRFQEYVDRASTIPGEFAASATAQNRGLNSETVKDPEMQAKVYNSIYNELLAAKDAQLPTLPLPIEAMSRLPEFQRVIASPTYQEVIAPVVASASTPVTIQGLAPVVAQAVIEGTITSERASKDMSDLAKIAFTNYAATSGRKAIGAKLPDVRAISMSVEVPDAKNIALAKKLQETAFTFLDPSRVETTKVLPLAPASAADWSTYFQLKQVAARSGGTAERLQEELNK